MLATARGQGHRKPHFRVGDKIFAGCGEEKGRQVIGFKLESDHADAVMKDPRFWRAPYVGHKGWVSMDPEQIDDWAEVRSMVLESYRLIAPRRTVTKLEGGAEPVSAGKSKSAVEIDALDRSGADLGFVPTGAEEREDGRPDRGAGLVALFASTSRRGRMSPMNPSRQAPRPINHGMAVKACTRAALLPEKHRALDLGKLDDRLEEIWRTRGRPYKGSL